MIGLLICGRNLSWLLNLNLTLERQWIWVGSDFLISVVRNYKFSNLIFETTPDIIDVKMDGSVLGK